MKFHGSAFTDINSVSTIQRKALLYFFIVFYFVKLFVVFKGPIHHAILKSFRVNYIYICDTLNIFHEI